MTTPRSYRRSTSRQPSNPPTKKFVQLAKAFHDSLYDLIVHRYADVWKKYAGPKKRRSLPRAATFDPVIDTRRLAIHLASCPVSHWIRNRKSWPNVRTVKSSSTRFPSAWRHASPFVARGIASHVIKPKKLEWLKDRNPRVLLYTLTHQEIRLRDKPAPEPLDVWHSMLSLWLRMKRIEAVLLREVGWGGLWSWDIAPVRHGGKIGNEGVLVHAHLLIEVYDAPINDGGKVHYALQAAWSSTATPETSRRVVVTPVKQSTKDLETCVRYVTGFPTVAEAVTSKLLMHFDKTRRKHSRRTECIPSRDQLRLLLAFYTCPIRIERLLGVWNGSVGAWGKKIAHLVRLDTNPNVAPPEFHAVTYPKRWLDGSR